MMVRRLVALLVGLPLVLTAASPVLTLDEALRQAAANHPDLAVQRRQLDVAVSERIRAGFWLPDNPNVQAVYGPGGDADLGLTFSQQVEIAGQRSARQAIAEAGIQQARAEIAAFRQEALADVKEAFYDVLYWQERLSLADAAVQVATELDSIARQRLAAQDIADVDAVQATLALDGARAQRADVASQLQVSQVGLARLTGTPGDQVSVVGALSQTGTPPNDSDALAQALARRQDLQALQAQWQQTQGQLDLTRREIVPDPTLSLSYGLRTARGNPGANVTNEAGNVVQFGVSLPVPVVNYRQGDQARLQAEMAVLQAKQAALQTKISRQVGEALAGWRLRLPAARTYQAMLPALQHTLALLRAAYREGQVDLQRVLIVQDQLLQTRTALLDVQRQLRQSEIAVDRALGRIDVAEKETP
jgi:cobalt-zinc-cadmium efflux system outer membrane protein